MSLEAHDLAVGHRGVALQRGLRFALAPGERLAIAGPSGAGKTTLLRALATLDPTIEGRLLLDGATPEAVGFPTWRRRVIYVAQRATFFGDTLEAELARPFGYRTSGAPFDPATAREALRAVRIRHALDAAIDTLSEGERQRVALVRAALLAPAVLLLDEPTSALDAETARDVEAWLLDRDAALVLVSHDPAQRERMSRRTLSLEAPA